ncbi:MAG: cytidylyltransferase domain-containing protein [Thermoanaerobaculia bacterium]
MKHPPSVVTVIQARTGSSRLPGKILLPLAGAPVLVRIVERVTMARHVGAVIIATTVLPEDDRIQTLCWERGILCFRGDPTDLLDRHYRAAAVFGADLVAKIPSDCPLIDPMVIDRVLGVAISRPGRFEYISNLHPPSWPDGNDVEVMTFAALETAWREANRPHEREHTTPFLWDQPDRFRIANVCWETGRDLSRSHRFTLDYPEDYELIRHVYEALWPSNPSFGTEDVVDLLERLPDVAARNARYRGVNWYRHHLGELRTVGREDTRDPEAETVCAGGPAAGGVE